MKNLIYITSLLVFFSCGSKKDFNTPSSETNRNGGDSSQTELPSNTKEVTEQYMEILHHLSYLSLQRPLSIKGYLDQLIHLLVNKAGNPKALVNLKSITGETALIYAAKIQNLNSLDKLLAVKGIDVNTADTDGKTALIYAVVTVTESLDVLERLLIVADIKVNVADKNGKTALFYAIEKANLDIVKVLLAVEGIDVNTADTDGKTALIHAVVMEEWEIALELLAVEGINVNIADKEGMTALTLAEEIKEDKNILVAAFDFVFGNDLDEVIDKIKAMSSPV